MRDQHVEVANVRTVRAAPNTTLIYVGRGRAPEGMEHAQLGNPFRVGPAFAQGEAAAAYLPHLRAQCRARTGAYHTILNLARRAASGEHLMICCWCHPQPCHAEHIRAAVLGYAHTFT